MATIPTETVRAILADECGLLAARRATCESLFDELAVLANTVELLRLRLLGICASEEGAELAMLDQWAQSESRAAVLADGVGVRDYFSGVMVSADECDPAGIVRPWPIIPSTTLAEAVEMIVVGLDQSFGRCTACGELETCTADASGDPVCADCMPVWSGAQDGAQ